MVGDLVTNEEVMPFLRFTEGKYDQGQYAGVYPGRRDG